MTSLLRPIALLPLIIIHPFKRGGATAPNLGLAPPPNVTQTLFDELKASAYRCKKERSVAFNIRQNAFAAGLRPGRGRVCPHWICACTCMYVCVYVDLYRATVTA